MPETTPLIKAALNLRVGAGFDVYSLSSRACVTNIFSLIKNPPLKLSLNIILREDSCNVIELVVQKLCCI